MTDRLLNPEVFIMMALLSLLAAITIAIIRQRNMFGVVILSGVYSFLMASIMMALDAPDVAMTEASVGAGVSTVILLAALHLTGSMEYPRKRNVLLPLFVVAIVGAAIVWGTIGLPDFGIAQAPIHLYNTPRYIEASAQHQMPPNMVSAVLADFRGYDTMGETTVVLTAGLSVLLLLRGRPKKLDDSREPGEDEA